MRRQGRHHAAPLARLGADVTGIDIASNLVEAGNRRAAELGLTNLKFQQGDACHLEGIADDSFDSVSVCIRGDVCAEALRCGEGDGPRDEAGRTGGHGQLDPKRSDVRGAGAEDQLGIYASAA